MFLYVKKLASSLLLSQNSNKVYVGSRATEADICQGVSSFDGHPPAKAFDQDKL